MNTSLTSGERQFVAWYREQPPRDRRIILAGARAVRLGALEVDALLTPAKLQAWWHNLPASERASLVWDARATA